MPPRENSASGSSDAPSRGWAAALHTHFESVFDFPSALVTLQRWREVREERKAGSGRRVLLEVPSLP